VGERGELLQRSRELPLPGHPEAVGEREAPSREVLGSVDSARLPVVEAGAIPRDNPRRRRFRTLMPITYRIDRERSRIITTCSGDVTLPEVMAHFDELQRDPEVSPRLNVLLDLTQQTSIPLARQMQAAADRVGLVTNIVFEACAIVASREAMFGMARMFEVL